MSKRYYVSDLVGEGTDENPFRPLVADYGVSWVGSIKVGLDGRPLYQDCLVLVETENHAALRNKNGITSLPDFPLDGKLSSIQTNTKNTMLAALQERGFDVSAIGNADGYRDALQAVGQQRDPAFNIDKFDVR